MVILIIAISFSIFLISALVQVMKVINMSSLKDREKLSPFECGFDPKNLARIPFSMRFFLLAIIFVVFDIEIILLIPTTIMLLFNSPSLIITLLLFLVILTLGLLYEWNEGSLNWST